MGNLKPNQRRVRAFEDGLTTPKAKVINLLFNPDHQQALCAVLPINPAAHGLDAKARAQPDWLDHKTHRGLRSFPWQGFLWALLMVPAFGCLPYLPI